MAIISGDIIPLNKLDAMLNAGAATVIIRQGRTVLGTGKVSDHDDFSIEISDEVRGEIEIELALHNAAPSLAVADGNDLHVTLLYNNVNNYIA